jgi:hypothetical protein
MDGETIRERGPAFDRATSHALTPRTAPSRANGALSHSARDIARGESALGRAAGVQRSLSAGRAPKRSLVASTDTIAKMHTRLMWRRSMHVFLRRPLVLPG